MLLKRLDHAIVIRFELEYPTTDIPRFEVLVNFLHRHCLTLETLSFSPSLNQNKHHSNDNNKATKNYATNYSSHSRTTKTSAILASRSHPKICLFYRENHSIHRCNAFISESPS